MDPKNKHLLVIAGPTAVGKTETCLNLAGFFQTEIISSDSRQFYKEMDLGTAKPSQEELSVVPHHFIDSLSIHEEYDVKKFEHDTMQLLQNLFQKHDVVLMTGGSGLYIDAVCHGFDDIPDLDPSIRKQLISDYGEKGVEYLQVMLERIDPVYYNLVDRNNPQRLMRALEVGIGTGKPYSSFRKNKKNIRDFQIIKIGLERDREELYQRIDQRMDLMIEKGLFEEAEQLFPLRHLNALQTVGYSEIFGFLEGKYNKGEAIRLLKRNSRRYAKRQLTWFKRISDMKWFHPDQFKKMLDYITSEIE
ncbi:tRNA (adenosine(37)-N6)-dimethylallyltransferase MiaA [Aquiflexum lacus]|uniref:tRNA (adenosine(37)-N6)-dimethylallyltransferase MiaA n=1 Tax=Aquiflexum lacus TaxID=2483805 RepID=UPI0018963D46|nr:tRNA (adenosine(37)-N6)-dimethylallyltransferase MiaA [Aquiflexum lacus]